MLLHTPSSETEMTATFSESLRLPPPDLPFPAVKTSKASHADLRTVKLATFSVKLLLSQLQYYRYRVAVPPETELQAFAQHLLTSTYVSTPIVILALLYIQRRFPSAAEPTSPKCEPPVSSSCASAGSLSRACRFLSAYHVLTVGLILSTKFLEDHTHTNGAWADVSGLSARELSTAEWQWLSEIKFNVFVTANDYFAWVHHILPNQPDYPPGVITPPASLGSLNSCWPSRQMGPSRRHSHEPGPCQSNARAHLVYSGKARGFKVYVTPPPSAGLVPPTSCFPPRRHSSALLQPSGSNGTAVAPHPVYPLSKSNRHTPYYAGRRPSGPTLQTPSVTWHRGGMEYEVSSKLSRLSIIHEQKQQLPLSRLPGTTRPPVRMFEDLN